MAVQQPYMAQNGIAQGGGGMAPLPPIPPPQSFTMRGPVDLMVPQNPNGTLAGPVSLRPSQSQAPMSAPNGIPGTANVPPPHMLAPYVYKTQTARTVPAWPQASTQNNFYNNNYPGYYAPTYYPPYQYPQYPQPQQPQQPQQQQQPPPRQNQAQNQPKQPQQPPKPQDTGALTADKIRNLNKRLNDANETVRADAALEVYRILEGNPQLADDPQYKEHVNAFIEKILKDPSAVVRQPGLMAMELGHVKNPGNGVKEVLTKLSEKGGLMSIESDAAQKILASVPAVQMSGTPESTQPAGNTPAGASEAGTAPPAPAASETAATGQTPKAPNGQAATSTGETPPAPATGQTPATQPAGQTPASTGMTPPTTAPGTGVNPAPAGGQLNRMETGQPFANLAAAQNNGNRLNLMETGQS